MKCLVKHDDEGGVKDVKAGNKEGNINSRQGDPVYSCCCFRGDDLHHDQP